MPKTGFKSITVHESIYDRFQDVFKKSKDDLATKGINSFTGYITYMLDEMMQKDKTFARYLPKIEKLAIEDTRIILKDNIKNRIIEIKIKKNELFCLICASNDCVHIGFCFSMPQIYEILNQQKLKVPK